MTEHEVPTHVQAEDRVILWFTFPQIIAITAVCALSYGAYRLAPIGPSEVRMALAVMLALFGVAMIVGKVGGRRLPVVLADLLRFGLGPRLYAGPAGDLVRSEAPAPPPAPEKAGKVGGRRLPIVLPGLLQLGPGTRRHAVPAADLASSEAPPPAPEEAGKDGGRGLPVVLTDLLRFGRRLWRHAGPAGDLVRSEVPASPPVPEKAERVGGRRLAVILTELLRFGLRFRRHAGPAADLVSSEAASPPSVPEKARRAERWRRRRCRSRARRTFRAHGWFGKRRRRRARCISRAARDGGRRRGLRKWLLLAGVAALSAAALAAMSLTAPPPASGQEPEEEFGLWDIESEIDFQPREPVPGRRLYYEELRVAGERAHVTLRAATGLEIRVRAFGGLGGRELRYWSAAALDERGTVSYSLPLAGDEPSLTFSWEDGIGQGGAVTVGADRIPHPLPSTEGEICKVAVTSLGWTPGKVEGVISSECVRRVDEVVKAWTVVGHELIGVDAVIESKVTAVTGTVRVTDGGYNVTVPLVAGGDTGFTLPVAAGDTVRTVQIDVDLKATLEVPMPDLVRLTHHPQRTERVTQSVRLWRPGTGRTVSRTVTVHHGGGLTTQHTISAYLSVPGAMVTRNVTVSVDHEEHVRAVVEPQQAIQRTRRESLALAASIGADARFRPMVYPEPELETPLAEQVPVDFERMRDLFGWH